MKKILLLFSAILLFSNCEAIFVENISNDVVTTIAPSDGNTVVKGNINFKWNAITDAETYELQIATPTFTNASQVVLDTIILKTSFTKELSVGNYQWRVKAINSDYQTRYTTNTFVVQ